MIFHLRTSTPPIGAFVVGRGFAKLTLDIVGSTWLRPSTLSGLLGCRLQKNIIQPRGLEKKHDIWVSAQAKNVQVLVCGADFCVKYLVC